MGNNVTIYGKDHRTATLLINNESTLKELEYRNLEREQEEKRNEKRREDELKEKREKSFKRGLKKLTISDGMKSSVHCFPTFSDPKAFLLVKIVWMLIAMSSWSYWLYQTYGQYQNYASYGVISSYSMGYDTKTIFPAVSICNLNPYDGDVSKDYMDEILADNGIDPLNYTNLIKYTDAANNQFKASFEYKEFNEKTFSLYYQGYYLSQMLFSCEFNGVACTTSDFFWYHDYNYGNCYKFNGGDPSQNGDGAYSPITIGHSIRNSRKPGWENGLRIEMFVGRNEQLQYIYKTGIRIIVHNQSYVPFPDEDGIDIATRRQTNIGIRRKFINRLSDPYSNCVDELNDQVASKNNILLEMNKQKQSGQIKLYQQQYCLKICQQYYYVDKCKCYSYALLFLNVSDYFNSPNVFGCVSPSDVQCLETADLEFTNSDAIDQCYAKCPQQCNEIQYDLRVSEAHYPTYNYYASIFSDFSGVIDYDAYNEKTSLLVMFNVFYESNIYTIIQESPSITFYSLIANIGGNMGLFTGASVLSLIELVEYFLSSFILFIDLKILKNSKNKQLYKT